jgi:glycosyltransferase involved in cell wall biosynthesis
VIVLVCRTHPEPTQTFHRRMAAALARAGVPVVRVSLRRSKTPGPPDETVLLPDERAGAWGGFLLRPLAALGVLARLLAHAGRGNKEGGRPGALLAWVDGLRLAAWARRRGGVGRFHAQFASWEASSAWTAARVLRVPFSFEVHAPYTFVRGRGLLRAKARAADVITAISLDAKRRVAALAPECEARTAIVRCGVDAEAVRGAARAGGGERYDVVAVGSLIPCKGHDVLVDAVSRVAARRPGLRAAIVGEGPERTALAARIRATGAPVALLGTRSETEALRLTATATVAALACVVARDGNEDGIPVALIEAMAAGVPVVSTRVGGVAELLEDGGAGLLAPPGDAAAFADALDRLLGDAALRARLAAAGRAAVAARHDLDANARALAAALHAEAGPR